MKPERAKSRSSNRPLRRSRTLALLLGASFVIPFAILFTLLALNVPLGQGYFEYRYSPVRELRTPRAFVAIAIGLLACAVVWVVARPRHRRTSVVTLLVTFALWGVWSWWAPPNFMTQQMFSLTSPSSDGAFVIESQGITSLSAYLRGFEDRLQTPVERMGGTRVLSNPPGMTVFAHVVSEWVPGRAAMQRYLMERQGIDAGGVKHVGAALRVGMALCAVWVLSGAAAYALGRLFLSSAGAAVFAIAVMFNPCAVSFVPGKDPAQLLTINAMLWAWLASWKQRSLPLAALAGAVFVIGTTFSLVHIWVALVALAATVWHDRRHIGKNILAAAGGAGLVVVIVYLAIGWNIPATLIAVSRRWGELQKTFEMNRAVWYAIGLPIFLLFVSPAVWTMIGLSLRRRRLNFGTKLAICSAAAMLLIYFGFGMTYELPRLWVVFLPPLLLGLCIDRPLLRGSDQVHRPRVALALMLIAATQITCTALHWTLFDVREIEWRLISQRFYN